MTEQQSEAVRTRTEGHVFEVTLDRPKANAIDLVTSRRMGEVFKSFRDDPELRVCIEAHRRREVLLRRLGPGAAQPVTRLSATASAALPGCRSFATSTSR